MENSKPKSSHTEFTKEMLQKKFQEIKRSQIVAESGKDNLWKHFFAVIGSTPSFTRVLGYLLYLNPSQRVFQQTTQESLKNFPCTSGRGLELRSILRKLMWPLAGGQDWLCWDWPAFQNMSGQNMFECFLRPNGGHAKERIKVASPGALSNTVT